MIAGDCRVVQWLGLHASTAGGPGSIPAQGTKIGRKQQQQTNKSMTADPYASQIPSLISIPTVINLDRPLTSLP